MSNLQQIFLRFLILSLLIFATTARVITRVKTTLKPSQKFKNQARVSPHASRNSEEIEEKQTSSQEIIVAIVAICFILLVCIFLLYNKAFGKKLIASLKRSLRKEKFHLSEQQKQKIFDELTQRPLLMIISIHGRPQKLHCVMKIVQLRQETNCRYRIKFTGKDQQGMSTLKGILVFQSDELSLKLSKLYDNKTSHVEVGNLSVMLFEGTGMPNKMEGVWNFYGESNKGGNSGTWIMSIT